MNRFQRTVAFAAVLVVIALPTLAAPRISKRIVTDEKGNTIVVVKVTASSRTLYGVCLADASASIEDIDAPEGWAAVSSDDRVLFRTIDNPIRPGQSVTLRIVTKNADASYEVTFRDAKRILDGKKNI